MKTGTLPTYLPNPYLFNILGDLSIEIEVRSNPFQLPLDRLFHMAARQNKKRGFLFVSPLLGKHIPVPPSRSLLSGMALANLYASEIGGQDRSKQMEAILKGIMDDTTGSLIYEKMLQEPIQLHRPTTFIGFAETATALGQSVFQCFGEQARFIHTTRETLTELSLITFEEEHSHAVAHACFPKDQYFFQNDHPIVLVDDEITTGKTCLNIIESIQKKFPRKEYIVASLLNWRSREDSQRFRAMEQKLGISIRSIALLEGTIEVKGEPIPLDHTNKHSLHCNSIMDKQEIDTFVLRDASWSYVYQPSVNSMGEENTTPYLEETGRFGLTSDQRQTIEEACFHIGKKLKDKRRGNRTLCMGTGEFMFVPMRIASHMGDGISYQSTTRSPIHPCQKEGYGIQNAFVYESPEDQRTKNYFYNIPSKTYDDVFVFIERELELQQLEPFIDQLKRTGIPYITFFICST